LVPRQLRIDFMASLGDIIQAYEIKPATHNNAVGYVADQVQLSLYMTALRAMHPSSTVIEGSQFGPNAVVWTGTAMGTQVRLRTFTNPTHPGMVYYQWEANLSKEAAQAIEVFALLAAIVELLQLLIESGTVILAEADPANGLVASGSQAGGANSGGGGTSAGGGGVLGDPPVIPPNLC
jgi:uncharacterized membrane protein YgcG